MESVERTTAKVGVYSCRCGCWGALHFRVVDEGRCRESGERDGGGDERQVGVTGDRSGRVR